jgi:predicted nucleotidyltransferase
VGREPALTFSPRELSRFAEALRAEIGAQRVLVFGSRARGTAAPDSDYDFIVVAESFAGVPRLQREFGLHDLFYKSVGRAPLDFICLTPAELEQARRGPTLVAAVLPEALELIGG